MNLRRLTKYGALLLGILTVIGTIIGFALSWDDLKNRGTTVWPLSLVFPHKVLISLTLASEPTGARVFLDGMPQGTTDAQLELSPGKHTIRLERTEYAPLEATFQLEPDGTGKPQPYRLTPLRTPRSPGEILTHIRQDLQGLPEIDRAQRRYLTLVHLHNNQRVTDAALQQARQDLQGLAETLSRPGQRVEFRAIDADRLVFALDLRHLGWTAENQWKPLEMAYPYALRFDADRQAEEAAADKQVREWTQSRVAAVRGDWLFTHLEQNPASRFSEPQRERARVYREQPLDWTALAGDLGLTSSEALRQLLQDKPDLATRLGLQALREGKTIPRRSWETRVGESTPYQEMARELNLGRPLLLIP